MSRLICWLVGHELPKCWYTAETNPEAGTFYLEHRLCLRCRYWVNVGVVHGTD